MNNETEEDPKLTFILDALMGMFEQYCSTDRKTKDGRRMYSHDFMTAGEEACEILISHNRITEDQMVA